MKEAGLVDAVIQEYMGGDTLAIVRRLTWDGCEFADAIRSDTLWKKAKDNVMKPSMSFTFDVLKDWLKSEITQGLPTLRALGQWRAQIHCRGEQSGLASVALAHHVGSTTTEGNVGVSDVEPAGSARSQRDSKSIRVTLPDSRQVHPWEFEVSHGLLLD